MLMIGERQILACTVGTVGYLDFRSQVSLDEMEAFIASYKEQLKKVFSCLFFSCR